MANLGFLATSVSVPLITLISLGMFPQAAQATSGVKVSCERQNAVPTVTVTLSNRGTSQVAPILSFLPEYFDADEAIANCQNTARKLHVFYNSEQMNYLASDTVEGKPAICTVERRGLGCDSYGSEILFSTAKSVSPTELLYNMLGKNFKGSEIPSSRTVSRIYTDLRPLWWPF